MTSKAKALPRPGASALPRGQGARSCSNKATNKARPEREQGNEQGNAKQGTPHAHEQGTRPAAQREIHTGVDVSLTYPNTWRLYAECPDATTDIIVMGKALDIPADPDAFAASEWPEMLLREHLDRCEDCATWRKRSS